MQKKETPAISQAQQTFVDSTDKSTAAKIRFLVAAGYSKADTARILNIRYQWVKNVMDKEARA
jgi:hypothetical protein